MSLGEYTDGSHFHRNSKENKLKCQKVAISLDFSYFSQSCTEMHFPCYKSLGLRK